MFKYFPFFSMLTPLCLSSLIAGIILLGEIFQIFLSKRPLWPYRHDILNCMNVYPCIKTCIFRGSEAVLSTTFPKRRLWNTTVHSLDINKITALLPATIIQRYCPHLCKALQSRLNYSCCGNINLVLPVFCS